MSKTIHLGDCLTNCDTCTDNYHAQFAGMTCDTCNKFIETNLCENCGENEKTFECDICAECAPNECLDYADEMELMGMENN